MSFIGDISLNDQYVELRKKSINPFESLQPVLHESDYVVGNLECLAKGEKGENLLKKPRLSTTVETLGYLNDINLKVACLAHNHAYDHLEDGFKKTVGFLENSHIQYLGAGTTAASAQKPLILSKNNISIGLLNYVFPDTHPSLPKDAQIHLNVFESERVRGDIRKLKRDTDHVVLILHWGGRVEGGLYPDYSQPGQAKELIDLGADLIIGHHSHTFQPYEIYGGKYIFYSLGNFCFSDYCFDGKYTPLSEQRRITGIVNISFNRMSYGMSVTFYHNDGANFSPLPSYERKLHVRNKWFGRFLEKKAIWRVYFFINKNLVPGYQFFTRSDLKVGEKAARFVKSIIK